jgi:hypothetical protein
MNEPAPPRKRRRFLRYALVFVGLLLLLVGFAPTIIANTSLKDWFIAKATADLNGKASAGGITLSWFGPAELRDVVVADAAGRPALTVPRATTEKTLPQLLFNSRDPGTITLFNPTLTVVTEGNITNIEQAIARYLVDDGSPSKPERMGLNLIVKEGTIKLSEAKSGVCTLHNFELALTIPKPRTDPIQLVISIESRTTATGTLKVDTKFAPAKTMVLTADKFDLSQLGPILQRFAMGTVAKGSLTSGLTFQWGEKGTSLNGAANVQALELAGPWLGKDTLTLNSLAVDSEVTQDAGILKAKKLTVNCDVGKASFAGEFDPAADAQAMLSRTGIALDAEIDLAKLAAKLPGLLRIKEGVEIREGTISAKVRSHPGEHGPGWGGTVVTTHLVGTNARKQIEWKNPLVAAFDLRFGPNRVPVFDKLEVKSDFIGLAAQGELQNFVAAANVDLQKLSGHLDDFVDLGYTLGGTAHIELNNRLTAETGALAINGTAKLANFSMLDSAGVGLREKQLDVALNAAGKKEEKGYRIDTASATIISGEDSFEATLKDPITDVRSLGSGAILVKLNGDFARWQARLGPLIGWPSSWNVAGTGTLATTVKLTEGSYLAEGFTLDMKNVQFQGAGLNVNEPTLKVTATAAYDRKAKAITLNNVDISCNTVGASAKQLEMRPTATGEYGLAGDVNLQANLGRLVRTLGLATEMEGLAKGTATFDAGTPGQVTFDADLKVENFRYGPAAKPAWNEPWITLQTKGSYGADALKFSTAKLARDGFAAQGQGKIDQLSTALNLDVDGTLTYDLSKIEPQLKAYLGKSGQATGTGTKPFKLIGNLLDGGKNIAVNVGNDLPGSTKKNTLAGNAALEWQTLKAYGFDVGTAELKANINDGFVKMSPVEATFGGGKVKLEPTLQLNPGAYDLTFAKGQVIQNAKLTPAACAEAIGYALPLIANVADATGTISFDLAENRIPLADPTAGMLVGTLTIHNAEVSPNELIGQIAGLFTQKPLKLKLAQDEQVAIRFEKGRVYHQNLSVTIDTITIRSSGSVGVADSTLDLIVEVPLNAKIAGAFVPASNPRIRDALAKQTVRIAVKGTMAKPQLEQNAFRNAMGKLVQDATKDAAADALGDLFKKK